MMFLEGLRILDLSRVLAGPLATQNLADMGASVLKVEAPTGDDTRHWGPPFQKDMAAYFQCCNRSKASLILDFGNGKDFAKLHALIDVADVVIDNFTPKSRAKWHLAARTLRTRKPSLITMSITGYAGQRIHEPGYDVMIQAESGMMAIGGPIEGAPSKVGIAVIDVLTGMMASNGILAALVRRGRTQSGASLEISLFQTALYSLVNVASNYLVSAKESQRWGNAHANIVPYQPFECADRTLVIGAGNQHQFEKLCKLLAIDDPGFINRNNAQRLAHRDQVIGVLSQAIGKLPAEQLLSQLRSQGIPCAPILRPDEAIYQAQQWDPQAILAIAHPQLDTVRMISPPLRGEGMRTLHRPPPRLGEGGASLAQTWLAES